MDRNPDGHAYTRSLTTDHLCGIALFAGETAYNRDQGGNKPAEPFDFIPEKEGATFAEGWIASHQTDLFDGEEGEYILPILREELALWFAYGYNWAQRGYPTGEPQPDVTADVATLHQALSWGTGALTRDGKSYVRYNEDNDIEHERPWEYFPDITTGEASRNLRHDELKTVPRSEEQCWRVASNLIW